MVMMEPHQAVAEKFRLLLIGARRLQYIIVIDIVDCTEVRFCCRAQIYFAGRRLGILAGVISIYLFIHAFGYLVVSVRLLASPEKWNMQFSEFYVKLAASGPEEMHSPVSTGTRIGVHRAANELIAISKAR